MHNLNIILRTCANVESFSYGNERPRDFFPYNKKKLIYKCLSSLCVAMRVCFSHNIILHIIDDHSGEEVLKEMEEILYHFNISPSIYSLPDTGNGKSLEACFTYANTHCNDLIYFCEDDYYYDIYCIQEMIDTYDILFKQFGHVGIHPVDYPDRYKNYNKTLILLGSRRHWRAINKTTCTFMIDKMVLESYYPIFYGMTQYGITPGVSEDTTINKVWEHILCISPIPTLANHIQFKENIAPFSTLIPQ